MLVLPDSYAYQQWRMSVFAKDGNKCVHCGLPRVNNEEGKLNPLHAHHIKSQKEYPHLQLDVKNGMTLCGKCHREEHRRMRVEVE